MGLERGAKPGHRVFEDAPNQRLLGREVVVERGDVDAHLGRHLTRAQAVKTPLGNLTEGGQDQIVAPAIADFPWPNWNARTPGWHLKGIMNQPRAVPVVDFSRMPPAPSCFPSSGTMKVRPQQ